MLAARGIDDRTGTGTVWAFALGTARASLRPSADCSSAIAAEVDSKRNTTLEMPETDLCIALSPRSSARLSQLVGELKLHLDNQIR